MIGEEFIRKLPTGNVDVHDTKLPGFVLRCRASGKHSYRMTVGRGQVVTLGTFKGMKPGEARAAAEEIRGDLSKTALRKTSEDPALTMSEARAQARRDIQRRRGQRRVRTFGAFIKELYDPWARENLKRPDEALDRLRLHFSEFNDISLSQIDGFQIEKWRSGRRRAGLKPATINRDLAVLRSALSRAVEQKLVHGHPMSEIKDIKVDTRPKVRYLTDAEEARLVAALTARDDARRDAREKANRWRKERDYELWASYGTYTDHLTPAVLVSLHTGIRRGELLALRWEHIDAVGNLTVEGSSAKTGKTRHVPLNRDVHAVLKAWRPSDADDTALVFPGEDGDAMGTFKTAFRRLLTAAKITKFRWHDLRHSFASKLVRNGVDLNTVRELLGHGDIKMTLRYAHLAPEHKAAAVAKLVTA